MGLHQNKYDPCLFTGRVINPSILADRPSTSPTTLGLYVNDFVYFSADPAVKEKFQHILKELVTVNFMGTVEWFLGTHFQWMITPEIVTVHLSQTGLTANLVEENNIHHRSITHDVTPYRSGLPIDEIAELDENKECPTFSKCKQKYQSIVGSIRWLAQSTRLDLSPSHSILSTYCNKPLQSHLNAALYVLHYIHSTIDYGFTFTSVVPMEITYMDTEDKYKYMVSKIHIFKVHKFKLHILDLEIIKIHIFKSIFRFPISSLGLPNFSFSEKPRRSIGQIYCQ
jgi:hypothetical protein